MLFLLPTTGFINKMPFFISSFVALSSFCECSDGGYQSMICYKFETELREYLSCLRTQKNGIKSERSSELLKFARSKGRSQFILLRARSVVG